MNPTPSLHRSVASKVRHKVSWFILLSFFVSTGITSERQFNLSTYFDSNPLENFNIKEPTPGLKVKGLWRFQEESPSGQIYGSILGQGLFEPLLFLDSKMILNGELEGYREIITSYRLYAGVRSFHKLYFNELQRSGRTTVSGSLKRLKSQNAFQEIGVSRTGAFIDYDSRFHYTGQRIFIKYTRRLNNDFRAEFNAQLGRTDYEDYPAKTLIANLGLNSGTDNQRDLSRMAGLHVKHLGRLIWGISINFEDINSNSVIGELQIWSGKLYASGRLSDQMFYHVMLNGMSKTYSHGGLLRATPFRDPEENIQNQLHIQVERVIRQGRVFYFQYSYIKNETVINHWFYTKSLFETGLKLTL